MGRFIYATQRPIITELLVILQPCTVGMYRVSEEGDVHEGLRRLPTGS